MSVARSHGLVRIEPPVSHIACPVCLSDVVVIMRQLTGQRTGKTFPLYQCSTCGSMFNPSGYRENDQGLANDRDYLVANLRTHLQAARELVAGLRALHPVATRLLDIGAGVGSLVMTAKEAGLEAEGVELNHHAVAWAADHDVALHGSRFHANLFPELFDIVTCNHVLEHLAAPRELVADAIKIVRPGGLLCLSVPFLPEPASAATRYALEPGAPGSPFFDNDAHVTHFSRAGLISLAANLGLIEAHPLECSLAGYAFRVR